MCLCTHVYITFHHYFLILSETYAFQDEFINGKINIYIQNIINYLCKYFASDKSIKINVDFDGHLFTLFIRRVF